MVINNIHKIFHPKNVEAKPAPASVPERHDFHHPEKSEGPVVEKMAEKTEKNLAPAEHLQPIEPAMPASVITGPVVNINDNYRKIEFILEDDLEDIYLKMSPLEQQKFKSKGEETTLGIIRLLAKPQVKLKKIIELIRDWLKLLAGVNRFFLEQTAKIKADKILAEARHRKI